MPKNKHRTNAAAVPVPPVSNPFWSMQALAWASLFWGCLTVYLYGARFPWIFENIRSPEFSDAPTHWFMFVEEAKSLVLLATLIPGMAAAGSYVLRLFTLPWRSALEEFVFSLGVGTAMAGYFIFGLGLLQLYQRPIFWMLWAGGVVLAWKRYYKADSPTIFTERFSGAPAPREQKGWILHKIVLCVVMMVGVLMSFVPEVFYDAMVYHLGVPNFFLHEGGIHYYPSIHAQFPFLRQMMNVWALALDSTRLAKLLHWSSGPLIIGSYIALSERYESPRAWILASLALFSMPMCNMNLWTSGIDMALTSYAVLAFFAWTCGISDTAKRSEWFTLAGLFCGICFSCKYPGVIVAASLCVATFIWIAFMEKNPKQAMIEPLRISVWTGLLVIPWLVKTWVMTGNPVYPYAFKIFGGRDLLADRLYDFLQDTGTGATHTFLGMLQTPWIGTMREVSSLTSPGVMLLGGLGFILTGLIRKDIRKPWFVCACLYVAVYWCCINAMTDRLRLAIPGLAAGCFLIAYPAAELYKSARGFFQFCLACWALAAAGIGIASLYTSLSTAYTPWDVWAGRETPQQYLTYTHAGLNPYPAQAGYDYVKTVMRPGHRLLILGDEKVSPSEVPFLASGVHNDSLIIQWARLSKDGDELARRFQEHQVSHVMINVAEALRLGAYKMLNWDAKSLAVFCEFFEKHLHLVQQVEIPERVFRVPPPILIYEFVEKNPEAPSENPMLVLFEQTHVPTSDPYAARKKKQLLMTIERLKPGLATVRDRIIYWHFQDQKAHGK